MSDQVKGRRRLTGIHVNFETTAVLRAEQIVPLLLSNTLQPVRSQTSCILLFCFTSNYNTFANWTSYTVFVIVITQNIFDLYLLLKVLIYFEYYLKDGLMGERKHFFRCVCLLLLLLTLAGMFISFLCRKSCCYWQAVQFVSSGR